MTLMAGDTTAKHNTGVREAENEIRKCYRDSEANSGVSPKFKEVNVNCEKGLKISCSYY